MWIVTTIVRGNDVTGVTLVIVRMDDIGARHANDISRSGLAQRPCLAVPIVPLCRCSLVETCGEVPSMPPVRSGEARQFLRLGPLSRHMYCVSRYRSHRV